MTELVKITLSKEWNKHKAGATLTVDTMRAAQLQAMGYLDSEKKVKKSARVSEPEK